MLENDISSSNRSVQATIFKKAESIVADEMEASGVSRNQAFSIVYDKAYREEHMRIKDLVLKKIVGRSGAIYGVWSSFQ